MGEAPAFFVDRLSRNSKIGADSKSTEGQVVVDVGSDKTYVIGSEQSDLASTVGVKLHKKSTNEWVSPTVLGLSPQLSDGYSAIAVDGSRILVINGKSLSADCFWFLETDTPFVREHKRRLDTEVVAWSKGVIGESEKTVVITGPSGVGKGTLISKLMEEFPSTFGFSVSHTTRAPRINEHNGVHYYFSDRAVMENDIKDGKFLEFADVHGNLYGTSAEAVEAVTDQGKRCILDIDVQGARKVRSTSLEAIFIFICPPSFEELEKRLRSRGTETEQQIQKRLKNARTELDQAKSPGLFDHILVNEDLEKCYEELKKILNPSDNVINNRVSASSLYIPSKHTVQRDGQKIMIKCSDSRIENVLVLDLFSMSGGAPVGPGV